MSWRILPLEKKGVPKLLIKSRFDEDGYAVQLTDLSCVYSEELTKAEIVQRAWESGSSIDPSEDDEQFQIFLGTVESALNCESGTSFCLNNSEDADIVLELEAPLPDPLPRFKWNVNLREQRTDQIQTQLVQPLIIYASSLQRQIQQLIDQLHDKDRVISKICDRLDTSGNDLTTVFPGASNMKMSRKKGQREQLGRHVKGLGDFDEASWKAQNESAGNEKVLNAEMANEVFASLPSGLRLSDVEEDETRCDWSEYLYVNQGVVVHEGAVPVGEHAARSIDNDAEPARSNGAVGHNASSMQVDEFQRQKTAPDRRRRRSAQSEESITSNVIIPAPDEPNDQRDEDSTTDDEDDLDAPLSTSLPASRNKTTEKLGPASSRKLGTIGGQAVQQQPPPPAKLSEAKAEAEVEKPRTKLGAIGGRPKSSDDTDDNAHAHTAKGSSPAPKPKLGAIGGKASNSSAKTTSAAAPSPDSLSTAHGKASARGSQLRNDTKSPEPQETAEELADRKRDQLRRELEQQAKAPAKKKRKF